MTAESSVTARSAVMGSPASPRAYSADVVRVRHDVEQRCAQAPVVSHPTRSARSADAQRAGRPRGAAPSWLDGHCGHGFAVFPLLKLLNRVTVLKWLVGYTVDSSGPYSAVEFPPKLFAV